MYKNYIDIFKKITKTNKNDKSTTTLTKINMKPEYIKMHSLK